MNRTKEDGGNYKAGADKPSIFKWLKRIFNVTTIGTAVGIISLAFAVFTYIVPIFNTFTATVKVQGWNAANDTPLRGKGTIELRLGDKWESSKINDDGEAIFRQISPKYKNREVQIKISNIDDSYFLIDDIVSLKKDDTSIVEVRHKGLDRFHGNIYDSDTDTGLQGVRVRIAGIEAYTNEWGDFDIEIPLDKQEIKQRIEFSKHGYESRKFNYTMVEAGDKPYEQFLTRNK